MNNRSILLMFIVCGLILSGLIVRNGKLLLLAMPFLVYFMIGVLQAPENITLVAERIVSRASAFAEEPFETHLIVKNQGSSLVNLYLADAHFSSVTIIHGKSNSRLSLPAGETTELNYVSKAARGLYPWKSIRACASDHFGLFELRRDISALGEILVRPMPIQVHSLPLKPRATLHSAGPISARVAGSGTDFWGVREYRAGDSLRQLNWRLAARHPRRWFINEYEQEEIADFGLILDARRKTDDDKMEDALFEYSVSAAASLSEYILKHGNRMALLIFGEGYSSLFPGYGKRQLNFALRDLARARLGGNVSLHYLQYFPVRLFPSHSQIIMFSTVDFRDVETYATLRAFGYNVLVVSPDPIEYSARSLPQTELHTLAVRAARIERALVLKQLTKMGVEVIDWQVNEPFASFIQRTARHSTHRRNI